MEGFDLDEGAYQALLKLLNNQHHIEKTGKEQDMFFLYEDYWLKDTAVISNIVAKNGMWEIYLVFAHHTKPHQFIKRSIAQFPNREQAMIGAQYMRRMAAKDQRGTLRVNYSGFNLSNN